MVDEQVNLRGMRFLVAGALSPCGENIPNTPRDALVSSIRDRGGIVEIMEFPFKPRSEKALIQVITAMSLLDLNETGCYDAVISTDFLSLFLKHDHKMVWLLTDYRYTTDRYENEKDYFNPSIRNETNRILVNNLAATSLRSAQKVFASTNDIADRMLQYWGVESAVLTPAPIESSSTGSENSQSVVVVFEDQHIEIVSDFLETLAHNKPECMFSLWGPPSSALSIEGNVTALSLEDCVTFFDQRSSLSLSDVIASACVIVDLRETDGINPLVLEAAAAGKPLLVSEGSGWSSDIVRSCNPEWLFRDKNEMLEVILKSDHSLFHDSVSRNMWQGSFSITWSDILVELFTP